MEEGHKGGARGHSSDAETPGEGEGTINPLSAEFPPVPTVHASDCEKGEHVRSGRDGAERQRLTGCRGRTESGHGLVCGSGLHLVVGALPLLAFAALELVGGRGCQVEASLGLFQVVLSAPSPTRQSSASLDLGKSGNERGNLIFSFFRRLSSLAISSVDSFTSESGSIFPLRTELASPNPSLTFHFLLRMDPRNEGREGADARAQVGVLLVLEVELEAAEFAHVLLGLQAVFVNEGLLYLPGEAVRVPLWHRVGGFLHGVSELLPYDIPLLLAGPLYVFLRPTRRRSLTVSSLALFLLLPILLLCHSLSEQGKREMERGMTATRLGRFRGGGVLPASAPLLAVPLPFHLGKSHLSEKPAP